jgi:chaperone LolA
MSRFSLIRRIVVVAIAFTSAAFAQQLTADEQKALVAKLQKQRAEMPAMTAGFTEERTTRLSGKPVVSSGTLSFQTPNKFRRELTGAAPSTTVCDGTELWIYFPKFKEVEHYTLAQQQMLEDSLAALTAGLNFDGVEKHFRYTISKDGDGNRIELIPKRGGLKRFLTTLTVWLDAEGVIQKTDAVLPKGDRVVTAYKSVRSAKKSDGKFEFTPPAGTTVTTPLGK